MSHLLNTIVSKDLLMEQAHELRKKNFRPGFDHMDARKNTCSLFSGLYLRVI